VTDNADLVIRGGTVIDGTGGEPFEADIAVADERIIGIGRISSNGREEIDAKGRIVTPGFIDLHTHYDGQVTWEDRLSPSSTHGVTTVVMGNCGVGFAPCHLEDRQTLMKLLEGVEDIPDTVMSAGLPWNWESFPEYLNTVAGRPHDVDIAALIPHSPLRLYVMGKRAINREPANAADLNKMAELVREAIQAGAFGIGTSRALSHRSRNGDLIPTLTASEEELLTLAMAMKDSGKGILQVVSDFTGTSDPRPEFNMWRRIVEASGRPMFYTLQQRHSQPDAWRTMLQLTEQARTDGLPILAQVLGRPSGLLLGLELSLNPFSHYSSYKAIAGLPLAARVAEMRKQEFRQRLLAESPEAGPSSMDCQDFERMFPLDDPPNYEPPAETSVAALARRRGVRPDEFVYDLLLEQGGRAILLAAAQNYADGSLNASLTMMRSEATIFGLGDGGAHYGMICDASLPTYLLSHWTRDRSRGAKMPLPWMVEQLTGRIARAIGLEDRGVLGVGRKADINVIDYDRLRLRSPMVMLDLPAGGRRIVQPAEGYVATIVSGRVTYRDGASTGQLPGRLLRAA
jgi:N-acyl-D-aspartate/D-glutamate deacylase